MSGIAVEHVRVFTHGGAGGNPCPIVVDASGLDGEAMREIAATAGHESGFVLPSDRAEFDYAFRFFVPRHEMEMCGHATIGALWLLQKHGRLRGSKVRISTLSGPVVGFIDGSNPADPAVEITQPAGKVVPLTRSEEARVLATLRISRRDLLDLPLQNAVTSRVKTLIPMASVDKLNALVSDPAATEACCTDIGSTGLYPYAIHAEQDRLFEARQFPKSSGYPEDAATGIAAAALAFGLLSNGLVGPTDTAPLRVLQGRVMGQLSEIRVRLGFAGPRAIGCLLGGAVAAHAGRRQRGPDSDAGA
jgi:PhzF family phenazine biosynthesis protein